MPSPEQPSNSSDTNGGEKARQPEYLTGLFDNNSFARFPGLKLQLGKQGNDIEDKNSIEDGTIHLNMSETDSHPNTPTTNDRPPISAISREQKAIIAQLHKSAEEFGTRLDFSKLPSLTLGAAEGPHPSEKALEFAETAPQAALAGDQEKNTPPPQGGDKADGAGTINLQAAETKTRNDDAAATAGSTAVNPLTPDARTVSGDTNLPQTDTAGQNEKVQFKFSPSALPKSSKINLSFRYRQILVALQPAEQKEFVQTLEQRYAEMGRLRPMVRAALARDLYVRFRDNYDRIMKAPNLLEESLKLARK
jgi:hypothetical protein